MIATKQAGLKFPVQKSIVFKGRAIHRGRYLGNASLTNLVDHR